MDKKLKREMAYFFRICVLPKKKRKPVDGLKIRAEKEKREWKSIQQ